MSKLNSRWTAVFPRVCFSRLRVVSNFGDALWGERKTRARAKLRGDATRGERQKLETTNKGSLTFHGRVIRKCKSHINSKNDACCHASENVDSPCVFEV